MPENLTLSPTKPCPECGPPMTRQRVGGLNVMAIADGSGPPSGPDVYQWVCQNGLSVRGDRLGCIGYSLRKSLAHWRLSFNLRGVGTLGDRIQGNADLAFFIIAGLFGSVVAWNPRRVVSFLLGRRRAAEMPDWVERFDRAAAALVVAGSVHVDLSLPYPLDDAPHHSEKRSRPRRICSARR
jgi:hypothetical protein